MWQLGRHYNLSPVLTGLSLMSWAVQTWMDCNEFSSKQHIYGQDAELFGPDGHVWSWGQASLENRQSEFLQPLSFVALSSFLVHRGSHEPKESHEAMQRQLDRIQARLNQLSPGRTTSVLTFEDSATDARGERFGSYR